MHTPVPLLALTAGLLVAGCGGDEETRADRKAAYIAQAEEICAEANAQVEELEQPTGVEDVPAYADRLLEIVRSTVQEVSTLEPPAQDREQLRQRVLDPLATDVQRAEQYAEQVRAAAAGNNATELLRLIAGAPQTSADLEFMRRYGFDECVTAADTRN